MNESKIQTQNQQTPETAILDPVKAEYMAYGEKPYREDAQALAAMIERTEASPTVEREYKGDDDAAIFDAFLPSQQDAYVKSLQQARKTAIQTAEDSGEIIGEAYDKAENAQRELDSLVANEVPMNVLEGVPANYDGELNLEFVEFNRMKGTEVDESLPYKPPLKVSVAMEDGSTVETDASTPYVVFEDYLGGRLDISLAVAGHIKDLHIDGNEAGSVFNVSSLRELMDVVGANLPTGVAGEAGVSAFSVETGRAMGEEGVGALSELLDKGLVAAEDIDSLSLSGAEIARLNLEGTPEDRATFVEAYNVQHPNSKIILQQIRGGIIIPAAKVPKQPTTELFMVFGPTGDKTKTMYTMAPGRVMPRMPNPSEHIQDGVVNAETFKESSDAWLNTVMLIGE